MQSAAVKALHDMGQPMHVQKLSGYMRGKGYFNFGTKDAASTLDACMARHSRNAGVTKDLGEELFYRIKMATYGVPWKTWALLS